MQFDPVPPNLTTTTPEVVFIATPPSLLLVLSARLHLHPTFTVKMDAERRSRWADAPSTSSPAPPTGSSAANDTASDAAARAAAIAAKIAASLRPGVQGTELVKKEKEEGDFVKDVEINDLRNRYVLTKGSTQKQVNGVVDISYRHDLTQISARSKKKLELL